MTIMIPKILAKRKRVKNVKLKRVKKKDVRRKNVRRMKVKRIVIYGMTMTLTSQLHHHLLNEAVKGKTPINRIKKKRLPRLVSRQSPLIFLF